MKQILFLILVLLAFRAFAQQPQLLQERSYNVNAEEKGLLKTAIDKQGNILFSGTRLVSTQTYRSNLLLITPNLDTVWTKKGTIDLWHNLNVLAPTRDGGFIFCEASKNPTNNTSSGLYMQKLTSSGTIAWARNNYFNNTANVPSSVLVMPDKGFLFCGYFQNINGSLLRTDSIGNTKWLRNHSPSSWGGLSHLQFTKQGKIAAYGAIDVPFGPGHHYMMILNQNGDSLKGKQLVLTTANRFESLYAHYNSLLPLSDGGFLYTGYVDTITSVYPNGIGLGTIVKLDSSFNVRWKYIHRTPTTDGYVFTKSRELADGSVLVVGFKMRTSQGGNGFQFYHFDQQGYLLNIYPFTSSICTQVWGITLDVLNDSTFMVGGRCGNNPPITYGYYVAKVKIPGLPHVLPLITPGTVTGLASEQSKTELYLGQSYPNPAAETAIIPYSLPVKYKQAQIQIRDITGREVRGYQLKAGNSNLEVNISNLSNGLYTYTLVADEKPVSTKKLAVMK